VAVVTVPEGETRVGADGAGRLTANESGVLAELVPAEFVALTVQV